jgi:hypothetical protein
MSNSVTLVGFVGAGPEQRQARNNGSKFTVLSVATQRSWKNAQDEWSSKTEWHRIAIFRPRPGRIRPHGDQEGRARPGRGQPGQLDLRTAEWQEQEVCDREDHVVVDPRRRRA